MVAEEVVEQLLPEARHRLNVRQFQLVEIVAQLQNLFDAVLSKEC
jgi:hypothetical protein